MEPGASLPKGQDGDGGRWYRHCTWAEIRCEHFEHPAQDCRLPDAPALIDELVAATPQAITEVADSLLAGFPELGQC